MKRLHIWFFTTSAILLAAFAYSVWKDADREWKGYVTTFNRMELEAVQTRVNQLTAEGATEADPEVALLKKRIAGIRTRTLDIQQIQTVLPMPEGAATRVDRCMTCHAGVTKPEFADAPQPYRTHPGDILKNHPVEKFGCTVCHAGQGLATSVEDAHFGTKEKWENPVLAGPYVQISCAQCHTAAKGYGGAAVLARGYKLFTSKPCTTCHTIAWIPQAQGFVGSDLTLEGQSDPHHFNFDHVDVQSRLGILPPGVRYFLNTYSIIKWHWAHFHDPQKVAPGDPTAVPPVPPTAMLSAPMMSLSDDDITALIVFVMSLKERNVPASFIPTAELAGEGGNPPATPAPAGKKLSPADQLAQGKKLYGESCATCHGDKGDGNGPAAVAMTPKPRDFTTGEFKYSKTDEEIAKYIAKPRPPMPPFTQYSDDDRMALVKYIHTFKK